MTAEERFWKRVNRAEDGCWTWTGGKTPQGYGQLNVDGRRTYAHRYSVVLDGRDPAGQDVAHTCHNPSCVRPDHLRVCSRAENMQMSSTFKAVDIETIRSLHSQGWKQTEIAKVVGCTQPNVSAIVRRMTWQDVA